MVRSLRPEEGLNKPGGDPAVESLAQQTYAFLATILAGGVVGFLFDLYRVVRSVLSTKQLATAMTDIVYWIVVTPTVFSLLLAGNWGELRFYVLLGLAVGLLLYFQTLSRVVVWLAMSLFRGVGQVVGSGLYAVTQLVTAPVFYFQRTWSTFGNGSRRRQRPPRLSMAWQRFSLSRIFSRFSG